VAAFKDDEEDKVGVDEVVELVPNGTDGEESRLDLDVVGFCNRSTDHIRDRAIGGVGFLVLNGVVDAVVDVH
jgi:hypothetical protein